MEKKTETRAKITTEMEASLDDSARKFSAGDVLIDKRHSQQKSAANLPQFNVKHLRKTRELENLAKTHIHKSVFVFLRLVQVVARALFL